MSDHIRVRCERDEFQPNFCIIVVGDAEELLLTLEEAKALAAQLPAIIEEIEKEAKTDGV